MNDEAATRGGGIRLRDPRTGAGRGAGRSTTSDACGAQCDSDVRSNTTPSVPTPSSVNVHVSTRPRTYSLRDVENAVKLLVPTV